MEFWVVAAATGAGYVAKYWHNLAGEKGSPVKLSPVQSPRVQRGARKLFDKTPSPVFPLPKLSRRCLLDGDVYSPEEEHNKVRWNLQDNRDEIYVKNRKHSCFDFDTSWNRSYECRTKTSKRKSFSRLRPLVVTSDSRDHQRKHMLQVDDVEDQMIAFMEENGAPREAEFFEPIGSVKLPRRPEEMHTKRFETRDLHSQGAHCLVSSKKVPVHQWQV